jgi:WD40-like Beta Propeller Repeat
MISDRALAKRVPHASLTILALSLLMAALFGCATSEGVGNGSAPGGTGGADASASGGNAGSGGELQLDGQTGSGGQVADQDAGTIVITPPAADLVIVDGAISTASFKATFEGQDVTSSVQWSYERPDIGDVDPTGTFNPTGKVGGLAAVLATLATAKGTAKGQAQASVTVIEHVNGAGLSPPQIVELDKPSGPADPAASIVYPYDETVFPLSVLAPEVQWNGASAGDFYRLEFKEKYYDYVEYFSADPPSRHLASQDDWEHIGDSGAGAKGDPLGVSLTRLSGSTAYQPLKQTWHIAQGRLRGSVYYWEIPDTENPPEPECGNYPNGRILRIKPNSTNVDEFFTPGNCSGCHTVSRDGKKLAFQYQSSSGPLYTLDLASSPVQYGDINPTKPSIGAYIQSAFNDKGDKLLASGSYTGAGGTATLKIIDATTGQVLNGMAMEAHCGEPAWSPDGKKIAGICGPDGSNFWFATNPGDLTVADVAADGVTTSNVKVIVPQGSPGRPAYPSFAPSSDWIAFGRPVGIGSYSKTGGTSELWMVKSDGSGLRKLVTATGNDKSWNPIFAPLRAGGYYWIAFMTRRDYGNELVGKDRQQLWITAIDDPPTANADPSHPPFYMRAQAACARSENAYFALEPCKDLGQSCASGMDCCNGHCIKQGTAYVCGEPTPGECSALGDKCAIAAQCCATYALCTDGFCELPPPK